MIISWILQTILIIVPYIVFLYIFVLYSQQIVSIIIVDKSASLQRYTMRIICFDKQESYVLYLILLLLLLL